MQLSERIMRHRQLFAYYDVRLIGSNYDVAFLEIVSCDMISGNLKTSVLSRFNYKECKAIVARLCKLNFLNKRQM